MQSSYVISDGFIHTRQNILAPLVNAIVYSQFKKSATTSIF